MHKYWKAFTVPLETTIQQVIAFVPRMFIALVLFLLFYGLAQLVWRGVRRSLERVSHIPWAVRILFARLAYLFTLIVGIMVSLSAANINVTTVLTSLGVAGFAIGFAMKDILENFISGILLLFARPFEVGDEVMLGTYEGTVKDIQIRTTTLHTYAGEVVVIPNSNVYTNAVINRTRLGKRRYTVDFDTSLTADTRVVEREALGAVQENPDVARQPATSIYLRRVDSANDTLGWRIFYWAEASREIEEKTLSEVISDIKRALYDAGIPVPDKTQIAIVGKGSDRLSAAVYAPTTPGKERLPEYRSNQEAPAQQVI